MDTNNCWQFVETIDENAYHPVDAMKLRISSFRNDGNIYTFKNFKCNNQNLIKKICIKKQGVDIFLAQTDEINNGSTEEFFNEIRAKYNINDKNVMLLEYLVDLTENDKSDIFQIDIIFTNTIDSFLFTYDIFKYVSL